MDFLTMLNIEVGERQGPALFLTISSPAVAPVQ
jgi:hypothetical protein